MKRMFVPVFVLFSLVFSMGVVAIAAEKTVSVKIDNPGNYPFDFQKLATDALTANGIKVDTSSQNVAEFTISTVVNRRNNDLINTGLGVLKAVAFILIPTEKSVLVVISLRVTNASGDEIYQTTQQTETQNYQWVGAFKKMSKLKEKAITQCLNEISAAYASK